MDRQHFTLALAIIFLITGVLYYFSTTAGMKYRWPRVVSDLARPPLPRYSMTGGFALRGPPGHRTAGFAARSVAMASLMKNPWP